MADQVRHDVIPPLFCDNFVEMADQVRHDVIPPLFCDNFVVIPGLTRKSVQGEWCKTMLAWFYT